MVTELGELCSDVGKPEITNINVCKEATVWLGNEVEDGFVDLSNTPDPTSPRGCYRHYDLPGEGPRGNWPWVVWNPVENGSRDDESRAICLKNGKCILVHIFSIKVRFRIEDK